MRAKLMTTTAVSECAHRKPLDGSCEQCRAESREIAKAILRGQQQGDAGEDDVPDAWGPSGLLRDNRTGSDVTTKPPCGWTAGAERTRRDEQLEREKRAQRDQRAEPQQTADVLPDAWARR